MSFALCGLVFGISSKKIYEWYRDVLSDFLDSEGQKKLYEHDTVDKDLIDKKTGEIKQIPVPILKSENFGENMAIDDKNIGGEGYIVLSNKDTGKIAALIMSTKAGIISNVLQKIPVKILMSVKTISKDLAENYDWIARTCFMNAAKIADKFHVIKLGMEALQAVRIRYRQEVMTKEREAREQWKKQGKKMKDFPKSKIYKNGDTEKILLARSRYLLFSFKKNWTESQTERANILFREFPEIKQAYDTICSFRAFYNTKIGHTEKAKHSLNNWCKKTKNTNIEEIKNFRHTVERHEGEIMNYFDEGHTNAFAESLNNKIQNFIRSNYGIRDRNFFHFRLMKSLS